MTQPNTLTAAEVLNTVGYSGFVKSLYNRSGDISKDFTHAVLGLVTETHELFAAKEEVNAIEEIGDLAFYLEALRQTLDAHSPLVAAEFEAHLNARINVLVAEVDEGKLADVVNEWLDLAKRWVGYGKAPTMSTSVLMAEAIALVSVVVGGMSEPGTASARMEKAKLVNVEKLLKRYNGMQFNAERAVNRDLPAERAVLEANAV